MPGWTVVYNSFEPEKEPLRETLTTLGNGNIATRGASEDCHADDIHYPGTYLAGGYNRLESLVSNQRIINEDLVNWPNWLPLTFRVEDGSWFNLSAVEILSYRQELNMREGFLRRMVQFRDHNGRESTVDSLRFVHMGKPNFGAIDYRITAHNWSGKLFIKSSLDGSVINAGVKRYRGLNSKHFKVLELGNIDNKTMFIHVKTNQSCIHMAQVAQHQLFVDEKPVDSTPAIIDEAEIISHEYGLEIEQEQTIKIEKVVAIYSSRDKAISECLYDARLAIKYISSFDELFNSHRIAWQFLWHRCDVEIDSNSREQLILRLHIFHLLQTVSLNSVDNDTGVPARGLHGEAYRGHIFWDELFIFPFYSYRLPEITRSLLLYRYRRLNMARILAKEAGFKGAMYPWQCGSNGEEETQIIHLNPRSNTWGPDLSRYQRHINAAIVYNIWQYYRMTNDMYFLTMFGAEMILEIARFWASKVFFSKTRQRYEIHNVVGPDEYHEQYPDSNEPGINNNAYTNVMAVWVLEKAISIISILQPERRQELMEQLKINEDDISFWRDITQKMLIPFHDNIISQFEGYERLKEFDWDLYSKKYGNIERLDRILKSEGDSPNHYKFSKQADVLMLFYLFSNEELIRIFHQLGYKEFNESTIRNTLEYYRKRTTHGSTLSKVVFAYEIGCIDEKASRDYFHEALESDISDIQGGTTAEGIHLGAMSGTVDIVMRQYAGIAENIDGLHFSPYLPSDINSLRFRIQHHANWYQVWISQKHIQLLLESGKEEKTTIYLYGKKLKLVAGKKQEYKVNGKAH